MSVEIVLRIIIEDPKVKQNVKPEMEMTVVFTPEQAALAATSPAPSESFNKTEKGPPKVFVFD